MPEAIVTDPDDEAREAGDIDELPSELPNVESADDIHDRPTMPVPPPRDSGVQLKIERIPWVAATVDVVLCPLTTDPRSEEFDPASPIKPRGVVRATPRISSIQEIKRSR